MALSAFSNSMDGLIVCGIAAARDADGVDCAEELQPITNIERFRADITRLSIPARRGTLMGHTPVLIECLKSIIRGLRQQSPKVILGVLVQCSWQSTPLMQ